MNHLCRRSSCPSCSWGRPRTCWCARPTSSLFWGQEQLLRWSTSLVPWGLFWMVVFSWRKTDPGWTTSVLWVSGTRWCWSLGRAGRLVWKLLRRREGDKLCWPWCSVAVRAAARTFQAGFTLLAVLVQSSLWVLLAHRQVFYRIVGGSAQFSTLFRRKSSGCWLGPHNFLWSCVFLSAWSTASLRIHRGCLFPATFQNTLGFQVLCTSLSPVPWTSCVWPLGNLQQPSASLRTSCSTKNSLLFFWTSRPVSMDPSLQRQG